MFYLVRVEIGVYSGSCNALPLVHVEFDRAKMQHNLQYLQKLKAIKVDLTRYLVNQQPAAIAQELQVVPPGGEVPSNIDWLKQAFTCRRNWPSG